MSKQDEIKQGIQKTLDGYDSTLPIDKPCPHCAMVDNILDYLHSQGVVIKVDRELTEAFMKAGGIPLEALKEFRKAGYEAVEPLR